jgi:hypothetical protein
MTMRQGRIRTAIVSAIGAAAMLATLIAMPAPALAAASHVKGEVISIMCYEGHGKEGTGKAHLSCATSCAKKGYALGILTADGEVYQIAGPLTADNNAKLQPLLSTAVTASGEVSEKDGKKSIAIASMSDITASK